MLTKICTWTAWKCKKIWRQKWGTVPHPPESGDQTPCSHKITPRVLSFIRGAERKQQSSYLYTQWSAHVLIPSLRNWDQHVSWVYIRYTSEQLHSYYTVVESVRYIHGPFSISLTLADAFINVFDRSVSDIAWVWQSLSVKKFIFRLASRTSTPA